MEKSQHEHVETKETEIDAAVDSSSEMMARPERRRDLFLPISILAAAVMVCGAIVFSTLYKGGSAAPAANTGAQGNAPAAAQPPAVNNAVMALGSRDAILGQADAKVTIVEYGDYQCPYCGQFFSQTESQIVKNYVNTGKVKMVFRDFAFLGAESNAAANAAQCAQDQNKLWAYHDALYGAKWADFSSGGSEDDGFFNRAEFLKLAQKVGLNISTFTSCIDNNSDASIVAQEKASASTQGVNSTPAFFVNGTAITGAQPYSVFQQAIDAALAKS